MRKVVISGMIGNGLEWYDYALYGHLASIISKHYFPSDNPYVSLIATFGVFAAGFAMRPIGAILFGYIGDRCGRKVSLAISILMMAIPTACIGLLPTYEHIGIWAPILLTVIRLLQGLSLGGEFSGSITFVVEHAPAHQRGYIGSTSLISLCGGMLLGSAVAALFSNLLPPEDFESYGWRIPFLLGLAIGLIGLYIRSHLDESPAYLEAKEAGTLSEQPVRDAFRYHFKDMLVGLGIYLTVTVPFYCFAVFLITFQSSILKHSVQDALLLNTIGMSITMVLVPFTAALSDRIGRRPILIGAALAYLVSIYPIFWLMAQPGFMPALVAEIWFALIMSFYISPVPALLVELFPTSTRYTSMALSYNICAAAFGGTMPMVSTLLIESTGMVTSPSFYIMLCAFTSLLVLYFFKDNYDKPLR